MRLVVQPPVLALVLTSGCALHQTRLEPIQRRLAVQDGDVACGPVGIRRVALASRWGEYFEVKVEGPSAVFGEARVHVKGRAQPLIPFTTTTGERIVRLTWRNERLSVPSALEKNTIIDVTLTNLHTAGRDCEGVQFTVTQGAFEPDRGEEAWIAELVARGGPDVAEWKRQLAEEKAAAERAAVLASRPKMPSLGDAPKARAEPEWAAWAGEEMPDERVRAWAKWPYASVLSRTSGGTPLGKGLFVVWRSLPADEQPAVQTTARQFRSAGFSSPAELSAIVSQVSSQLGSDEAAVVALFAGLEPTRQAITRRGLVFEGFASIIRRTDPIAFERAALALSLGTAFTLSWPVPAGTRVSSPFGHRVHPTLGVTKLHGGVDLSLPEGSPVRATADGVVLRASEDPVSGRFLVIDHGHGVTTAYCHNSKVLVAEGQPVSRGEVVSESGNTGRSTGPHLHYQLELNGHPIDPLSFLREPDRVALGEAAEPLIDWARGTPR